jgi:hypothetical protein
MNSIDILREEIHALSDSDLILEARKLRHGAPPLSPALAATIDGLIARAERDLKRRMRGAEQRDDARGRLRTFCFNMRVNAATA